MNRVRLGCWSRNQVIGATLTGFVALTWGFPAHSGEQPAPEYTARVLGSTEEISLASLRAQVVLLNTWATWCSPCRKEMPDFENFYGKYRERGLTVVGVNIDEGQADENVERYVEAIGVSFPVWRDPQNRFGKRFRVLGVPETFLIDREDGIVQHWRGPMDPSTPENLKLIEAVLAAPVKTASAPQGNGQDEPTPKRGRRLAEQRGCLNCHSTDGSQGVGPSLKGLVGTTVELTDGRRLVRDRDYLARAIREPDAEIVAGYGKGVMAGAMPGKPLTETEVEALIRYLTSLSDEM